MVDPWEEFQAAVCLAAELPPVVLAEQIIYATLANMFGILGMRVVFPHFDQ
jgi:hypothetical protein